MWASLDARINRKVSIEWPINGMHDLMMVDWYSSSSLSKQVVAYVMGSWWLPGGSVLGRTSSMVKVL